MNMEHMAFKVQSTKYKVQYNIPTVLLPKTLWGKKLDA